MNHESWDFPGVMAQIGEGLMSSLKSLNATNLMVTKSGVGVHFTCSDVAGVIWWKCDSSIRDSFEQQTRIYLTIFVNLFIR